MGPLCQKYFGLRLIGIPELFEALCWCVIGQQINLTFAYKLKQRLVHAKGEKLSFEGCDYFLFPPAEAVAAMSPENFTKWQFSNSKARFLIGIARAIENGQLGKSALMQMTDDQSLSHLLKLTGIGPWSAHYVMMKCLRMTEAYPIDDVGLHNAIKASLGNDEKPSRSELERLGGKWHPLAGICNFLLMAFINQMIPGPTDRLTFRFFETGDLHLIQKLNSDPSVTSFVGGVKSQEEISVDFDRYSNYHKDHPGFGYWFTSLKKSSEFVGFFLVKLLAETAEVEIGYRLLPEYWGRGLATEGARQMVRYAFNSLKTDRVVGVTLPENVASRRVLEKAELKFVKYHRYYQCDCAYYARNRKQ